MLLAALVTLGVGAAVVLLLRTFLTTCVSYAETLERVDLSWKDYRPIHRLLDSADFDYLRRKGISEARIRKLRVERRKIYRLCLRSLARDFNQVHQMLSFIVVQAREDRPELTAELAKQRLVFYRNLVLVELRLTLDACGLERMPAIDLLGPLEILQSQLSQLAPSASAA
jgi:hypothetical protein